MSTVSKEEIRDFLKKYLEGKCFLPELQIILSGYMRVNFDVANGIREINNLSNFNDIKIFIKIAHLKNMLQKFIKDEITLVELSNWAAFVYMQPFYSVEEIDSSNENPIWDVIQELANPQILSSFTKDDAKNMLLELK